MSDIVIIQSSLRTHSHTAIVCQSLTDAATAAWHSTTTIDLRDLELEFCDGRDLTAYNRSIQSAYATIDDASIIIFGMPVYNYSMSGVLKNFVDITAHAMTAKHIGVLVNAGGPNCYMAWSDLLNALYYEVGARPLAPIVYTWSSDFADNNLTSDKPRQKIDELVAVCTDLLHH